MAKRGKATPAATETGSTGTTDATVNPNVKTVKNKADGLKVLSTVSVLPSKCKVTDKFRGRSQKVSDETIYKTADSIRDVGQLHPVQGRQIAGTDEYEILFGNVRTLAGQALEQGYTAQTGVDKDGNPKYQQVEGNPNFRLRLEVVECSDEEAFKRNVTENNTRENTTPIDNAKNHEILRTEYGMSDAAITRLYGYKHQASVTRLRKLLNLSEEFQNAVHVGDMTASAAYLLLDVPEESRGTVWLLAVDSKKNDKTDKDEGGIGGSAMADAIKQWRKKVKEDAEAAAAANGGGSGTGGEGSPEAGTQGTQGTEGATGGTDTAPRTGNNEPTGTESKIALTFKQTKDSFKRIAGTDNVPHKVAECCNMVVQMMEGSIQPADMAKWLMDNLPA